MRDWLKGLLAGDQSSVPADAEVTRDAQGRVVSVRQTLRPEGGTSDTPPPDAAPPLDPALAPEVAEAAAWVCAQNVRLAQSLALGLEQRFVFDQAEGVLELTFAGGRRLRLPAHVLGSFDPRDGSFLWGWANPSLRAGLSEVVAAAARPLGGPFAAERLHLGFDALTPLLALAGRRSGADGLYRCVGEDVSLFLAVRADLAGEREAPDTAAQDRACALVEAWDAEMLPLDAEYHARSEQEEWAQTDDLLARAQAIYDRDWCRDDDYWAPCSFGWPSDHDPATLRLRFAAPHPDGGVLCVAIGDIGRTAIHHVREIDGRPRIVDQLIDWGRGLVWPEA